VDDNDEKENTFGAVGCINDTKMKYTEKYHM